MMTFLLECIDWSLIGDFVLQIIPFYLTVCACDNLIRVFNFINIQGNLFRDFLDSKPCYGSVL